MAKIKKVKVKTEEGERIVNIGADASNVDIELQSGSKASIQELFDSGNLGGSVEWNNTYSEPV